MGNHLEVKSSNLSWVRHPVSIHFVNSTSSSGSRRFLMLWMSLSVTAFRKAPSMSRNRTDATLFDRQASLIIASSRCTELVVDRPGCPPR